MGALDLEEISETVQLESEAPPPPLLLDVTPHTLAVETVGGFCEPVINRNSAIPAEQTKIFSTARDQQDSVQIRICQGESRKLEENQLLGELALSGLRRARRGEVKVSVSFVLGADGTLEVLATDMATGIKQEVRIRLVGGASDAEIEAMRNRQQAMMSPPG
jgi:molecular chaperone DnaK